MRREQERNPIHTPAVSSRARNGISTPAAPVIRHGTVSAGTFAVQSEEGRLTLASPSLPATPAGPSPAGASRANLTPSDRTNVAERRPSKLVSADSNFASRSPQRDSNFAESRLNSSSSRLPSRLNSSSLKVDPASSAAGAEWSLTSQSEAPLATAGATLRRQGPPSQSATVAEWGLPSGVGTAVSQQLPSPLPSPYAPDEAVWAAEDSLTGGTLRRGAATTSGPLPRRSSPLLAAPVAIRRSSSPLPSPAKGLTLRSQTTLGLQTTRRAPAVTPAALRVAPDPRVAPAEMACAVSVRRLQSSSSAHLSSTPLSLPPSPSRPPKLLSRASPQGAGAGRPQRGPVTAVWRKGSLLASPAPRGVDPLVIGGTPEAQHYVSVK